MFGDGCFSKTGLEEVEISSNVTEMGQRAFQDCKRLKRISFMEGSRLEKIGNGCFKSSGIEEL